MKRNSKSLVKKTSSAESKYPTQLRKSHYADFKFGLTVVLNPNEPEYGEALKNSYTGFKKKSLGFSKKSSACPLLERGGTKQG